MTAALIAVAIALGVLLVCFVVSSFVTILLMKKAQKKAFSALDGLVATERSRFEEIKSIASFLDQQNRFHAANIKKAIEEQEERFSSSSIDMGKAKVTDDFLVIYFQKYLREKNLSNKPGYNDYYDKLTNVLTIDPDDKTHPYYQYNKLALKYNSYANMKTASWYAKRKNYPQAPIL